MSGELRVDEGAKLKEGTAYGDPIEPKPIYLVMDIEGEIWCVGSRISNDDDRRAPFLSRQKFDSLGTSWVSGSV